MGEVRSEAAGTGPDVKPAPQRNGFPGESKVRLSRDQGNWRHDELGDHHKTCLRSFRFGLSSCINPTNVFTYNCHNLHRNTNKSLQDDFSVETEVNL